MSKKEPRESAKAERRESPAVERREQASGIERAMGAHADTLHKVTPHGSRPRPFMDSGVQTSQVADRLGPGKAPRAMR